MERGINYIFIGACFIASLVGLVVFIFWFSGSNIFNDNIRIYKAYSKQALSGIRADSFVRYKGINIGRVDSIRFKDNDFSEIEVLLSLRADLPIKKDSVLKIDQSGIIGTNFLTLEQNEKSTEFITKDDEAILLFENSSALGAALDALPQITQKVETLLDNANEIISPQNSQSITNALQSLEKTLDSIGNVSKVLESNTQSVESVLKNIDSAIANVNEITKSMNDKISSGEYDIKGMLTPALSSIEQGLKDIDELAKKGAVLLDNLESNPYNTIFGYREEGK